jgi:hypothetical protein
MSRIDGVVAVAVLVAAGWWGGHFHRALTTAKGPGGFYQEYFEPAVMLACGYGFHVAVDPPPAMTRFVHLQDDRFDCRSLPPTLNVSQDPLLQGSWLYLMLMVAATWRIVGISWSALTPLFGLLFGLTCAAAYVLFRFAMARIAAIVCVLPFALSTLHLLDMPALRDYARAPFLLALIALTLEIGLRPHTPRRLIGLCALYGALAGIGYGIRPDVVVQLPLLAITVMFFVPGASAANVRTKATALGVALFACWLTALPVLRATSQGGSNFWHVALIGFTPEYGEMLGVENGTYHWGVRGSDEAIQLAVADSTRRLHPDWPRPTLATREYEVATRSYYLEIARRFPADMVTRGLASIARMPEVAFGWPMPPLPGQLDAFYTVRERTLGPLYGCGILFTGAALIGVALARPRAGLFLSVVLAFVGSYPAIQFIHRHFFYLEVITWMSLGFLTSQLIRMIRTRQVFASEVPPRTLVRRALGIVAVVLTMVMLLAGVRAYQARHVRQTIAAYLRAPIDPVVLDHHDRDGTHTAAVPAFAAESASLEWARLLRVDLNAADCSGATVTFRYDRTSPYRGLTNSTVLPASTASGTGRLILFEPAYTGFVSVEFQDAHGGCLRAISRVTGLDDEAVWLPLVLTPDWRSAPLYQTVRTRENIH